MKNWAKEITVIGPTIDNALWTVAEIQRLNIPVVSIAKEIHVGCWRSIHYYKKEKSELYLGRLDSSNYEIQLQDRSGPGIKTIHYLYFNLK